jgi:transcriptional regulator with XRE-family HTH domain
MTERERMALRLIEYRKALSMSQADFAKKINKAQSVVCSWEKAQSSPDADLLPTIAKALDVTVSDLCGQADTSTSDQQLLDAFHEADIITQRHVKLLLGIPDSIPFLKKQ